MSEKDDDKTRLRIGGWLPIDGVPGSVSPVPIDDAGTPDQAVAGPPVDSRTAGDRASSRHRYSAASFLRRVTPSRPLAAIAPRNRNNARQAAAEAAAAARTTPAYLPAGGLDTDQIRTGATATRATTYRGNDADRFSADRRLMIGAGALFAVAALIAAVALQGTADRAPIRGEFAAGVPEINTPVGEPSTGTDGPGSDDDPQPAPTADDPDGGSASGPDDGPAGGSATGGNGTTGAPVAPGASAPGGTTPGNTPANPTTAPTTSSPTTAPAAPTTPATVGLTPGSRVGLEAAARTGHRIRHRDFVAFVEPVSASSAAGVKSDAAFVVRSGLASRSCVSFEAANLPGYYLRHVDFRVFLQRLDGSALFRADATFCPTTGFGGQHTALKSYNFPNHYLRHDANRQMRISTTGEGASAATANFLVRPAL